MASPTVTRRSQPNTHQVRHSADVAILLVDSYDSNGICGVNWFNSVRQFYFINIPLLCRCRVAEP